MTDAELLERHRSGDAAAFESLITRHEAGLLRYVTSLTRDATTAQDVVQEAFLALLDCVAAGDAPHHVSAWLFRVARNRAGDSVKKEVRMRTRHEAVAEPEATQARTTGLEDAERDHVLTQRFADLPGETREVLVLKIQEGKSYRDIGAITGFSLGKIADLVHKGLTQLSRELRAAGVV